MELEMSIIHVEKDIERTNINLTPQEAGLCGNLENLMNLCLEFDLEQGLDAANR